jgi:transcriptional regulator with XRE-family HTH domain
MRSKEALAKTAGISVRSVSKLEQPIGEPPVGSQVLEAVARVLPNWTAETPRVILDGGPAPSDTVTEEPQSTVDREDSTPDWWTTEDETRFQLLKSMLNAQGLRLTVRNYLTMRDQFEIEKEDKERPVFEDG